MSVHFPKEVRLVMQDSSVPVSVYCLVFVCTVYVKRHVCDKDCRGHNRSIEVSVCYSFDRAF